MSGNEISEYLLSPKCISAMLAISSIHLHDTIRLGYSTGSKTKELSKEVTLSRFKTFVEIKENETNFAFLVQKPL
ncbi:MAG: hypothetical protein QXO16_07715 [Archaeoglobaceae archaeon]